MKTEHLTNLQVKLREMEDRAEEIRQEFALVLCARLKRPWTHLFLVPFPTPLQTQQMRVCLCWLGVVGGRVGARARDKTREKGREGLVHPIQLEPHLRILKRIKAHSHA